MQVRAALEGIRVWVLSVRYIFGPLVLSDYCLRGIRSGWVGLGHVDKG